MSSKKYFFKVQVNDLEKSKIEHEANRLRSENDQLKKENENLEFSLLKEKTDHNILKEWINQFDDSKAYNLPDARHIY